MKQKRGYKRGYPVALLVGFEKEQAVLWQIFSRVIKPLVTVNLGSNRTDKKILFNFHESVVVALKPALDEGVRSIVITAPAKTNYASEFLDHVQRHHAYMTQPKKSNRASFMKLEGSADQPHLVAQLVKAPAFQKLIATAASDEGDSIVLAFEKHLSATGSSSATFYSLKEIEDEIYSQGKNTNLKAGHLLLTDRYLANSRSKRQIYRLMQIAQNKKVKTKVVDSETLAGKRISQFGGIVFFNAPIG